MKLAYIIEKMREIFVPKDVFELRLKAIEDEISPLQRVIYGFIGLTLVAVASYLIGLVLK